MQRRQISEAPVQQKIPPEMSQKPPKKRHRLLKTYFMVCGIAVNVVALVWLIVRLLVTIQTFVPQS